MLLEPDDRTGEELRKMIIDDRCLERYFLLGSSLSEKEASELFQFLKKNIDVFAWSVHEMLGIDPNVIQHRLRVNPNSRPVA